MLLQTNINYKSVYENQLSFDEAHFNYELC